jgi:malate synthase
LLHEEGTKTIEGLRGNIRVGMLYIESWLRGAGAAPINNLMEDLATAEISRIQGNPIQFLQKFFNFV